MSAGRVGFVVQELESYMFLFPQDGDVSFTPCLHFAGVFDHYEEAFDTARFVVGDGFKINKVWRES